MQRKWSSPHTTPSRVHWGFTCFKPRVWRGETSPPVQSHNKNSSGQIMVKTINQSEVWELLNNQIKQEAAEFWLSSADYWSIRNFSVSGQFVWNVVCLFNDWIRTFKELYIFFGHSCFDQSYSNSHSCANSKFKELSQEQILYQSFPYRCHHGEIIALICYSNYFVQWE